MAPRAGKARTIPATVAPPTSPAPGNHNQGPLTQEDMDDLFIVHLAQARKDDDLLEQAMEAVRAVRKGRTRNRNLCRTDGFPLSELDGILKDEKLPRHEVQEREEKRARMRGVANQPGGSMEQQELPFSDSFSKRDQDEAYWAGHGKTAGLRGVDGDPAMHEVPPEHWQVWLENWHEGQMKLAKAWATKSRIEGVDNPMAGAATPPATPAPEPEAPAPEPEAAVIAAEAEAPVDDPEPVTLEVAIENAREHLAILQEADPVDLDLVRAAQEHLEMLEADLAAEGPLAEEAEHEATEEAGDEFEDATAPGAEVLEENPGDETQH